MSLADRLVVMNVGRVLQAGTPLEVYHRPTCRFVAGFLGSPPMNFVEGRLVSRNGQLVFTWKNEELILPAGWLHHHAGQPVVLGIRPEALSLAPPGSGALPFSGVVALVEPVGDRADVTLRVGQTRLTARLDARQAPPEGDQLTLFAAPEACRWFQPGPEGEALGPSVNE
jgi:multiple sugar transport system ATP-binding protein